MTYAVIAAGEGSRLRAEGLSVPKPLVTVGGERLVDRLLRIFMQNGADRIVGICNGQSPEVLSHLQSLRASGLCGTPLPLEIACRDTPSSMHSLHAIAPLLSSGPFILTTVDTFFSEREFARYAADFRRLSDSGNGNDADGLFGVTDYVDDERPLWVATDSDMRITAFSDTRSGCSHVSAGVYGLPPSALGVLDECVARGESRLRNFQRALLAADFRLRAWPLGRVIDIDHVSDITKAEGMTDG